MKIFITGLPTSGKSYLLKELSNNRLNLDCFDLDHLIETQLGGNLSEWILKNSLQKFRELEKRILSEIKCSGCIIALGGGTLTDDQLFSQLVNDSSHYWIYIESHIPTVAKALLKDMSRPHHKLYATPSELERELELRVKNFQLLPPERTLKVIDIKEISSIAEWVDALRP